MFSSGSTLRTSADFDNAIMFGLRIEVWQDEAIIDYAGVIESHTNDSVTFMNESKYLKATCEFRVR
jgi:hypothetical protein